jgi:crossover junction endodeoxyribonuclease RuvC
MTQALTVKHVIGIDPGLAGAIAILNPQGQLVSLHDCPTFLLPFKKAQETKERKVLDIGRACSILREYQQSSIALIERVSAMPKQGVTSSFRFGEGYGIYQGIVAALSIPLIPVEPQVWKKAAGLLKAAKADSLKKAQELWPNAGLKLKKHEGKAEALLIAEYGLKNLTGILEGLKTAD